MSAADAVLNLARAQIGTVEDAQGRVRYSDEYGLPGQAWCAMGLWWCFTHTGLGSLFPRSAYTPTIFRYYEDRHLTPDDGPIGGDLLLMAWDGRGLVSYGQEERINHIGIVEQKLPDGRIQTVEFNTTPPTGTGNQGAGGGVWRRARGMGCVAGWVRPAYPSTAPVPPGPPPAFDPNTLPTLARGMTDPHVALFQKASNAAPWAPELPLLPITGFYGDQTTAVVRAAQAQRGVTGPDADGTTIGPRSKAAFAAFGLRW